MVDSSTEKKMNRRKKSIKSDINLVGCSSLPLTLPSTSSSSSSSSKKVLFWGRKFSDNKLSFYSFDIPLEQLKNQKLEPTTESVFDHRLIHNTTREVADEVVVDPIFSFILDKNNVDVPLFVNSFALVDSILYTLGGLFGRPRWIRDNSGTNLVHYIDIQNDNYCWKPTTSMIATRQNPQVIVANRTMYVFGCFGSKRCGHNPTCVWAETFNSSTREWSSLSVPMFQQNLTVCSSNPKNQKHVIKKISALVDDGIFYEFHLKTNSWTCIANCNKSCWGIRSCPTIVNRTFYWFIDDVCAYDILKDRSFEGPVQDLSFQRAMRSSWSRRDSDEEDDIRDIRPFVLHLGGRYFCLLSPLRDVNENGLIRIHCLVIKVSTTNQCYKLYRDDERRDIDKFFLGARVIACQSLHVDRQLDFIDGRLMMI